MKKIQRPIICFVLAVVLAVSMCACGDSSGGEVQADEWEGCDITLAMNENDREFLTELAAAITDATGGKIRITTVDRSSLGSGSDVLAMAVNGSLQMTQISTSDCETGTFPICAIAEIPFFSSSPTATTEMAYTLLEGGYLDKEFENIHVLFMWATDGQRMAFVNKKPETAADFQGMKFRSQSAGSTTMLEAMNATGTKISSSETYMSLQRGVVDGSVSSPTAMVKLSYSEVCKYLMSNVLYSGISLFICSNEFWDSIPAEYQVIINDVCQEFRYRYIEDNYNNESAAIEYLTSNGMEIFDASDEVLAALKDASGELVENYKNSITSYGYDADEIMSVCETAIARVAYHFD